MKRRPCGEGIRNAVLLGLVLFGPVGVMAGAVHNIVDFGAVADGTTLNTEAIQRTIDAAGKGDTVLIPEGTFLSGPVFVKSDMTLQVEGTLLGSADQKDYPVIYGRWEGAERQIYASLVTGGSINTDNREEVAIENFTITGTGILDANGDGGLKKSQEEVWAGARSRLVYIAQGRNITFTEATFKHSPSWGLHFVYCQDILIDSISVDNRFEGQHNGDGIDIESSSNVIIRDSHISSGDDNIAIKCGKDEEGRQIGVPSENIRILNCTFDGGFGVAIGSEMSGDVRDVIIDGCSFTDCATLAIIKTKRNRGGVVENVLYQNCTYINNHDYVYFEWFVSPITVNMFYFDMISDEPMPVTEETPTLRNITFRNITIEDNNTSTHRTSGKMGKFKRWGVYLRGLPENPMSGIVFDNVTVDGRYGLYARNVDGLDLTGVEVRSDLGEPYDLGDVEP